MAIFLMVLSVLALLYGLGITVMAKSAIHEIQAGVAFLTFAVFFSGAMIVNVLSQLLAAIKKTGEAAS